MAIRLTTYEHSKDVPELPGTNIFHSTVLFKVLEQTPGYHPVLLVAFDGDVPIGKLLCISHTNAWLPRYFSTTYIYGTGEYFTHLHSHEEIFQELLSYFTSCSQEQSFLLEFRNLEQPLFGYRYFRQNNYFPIKWQRVLNTLDESHPDRWMSSSRKRQIARGLKRGAQLEVAQDESEVKAFFEMLKHYYSPKVHRYLPDEAFFLGLQRQTVPHELSKIFIVRYKDRIIGGAVCLFSDQTAYLMFSGGQRKTYARLYPGVLAVWNALSYAKEHGYQRFEFINAGLPFKKYGYRDFILRFGGKQMSSRRWFKVRWKWLNRLLIRLYL